MHEYFANALSVRNAAYEQGVSIEDVLDQRFPRGSGGVGFANAKARNEIVQRLREWMEPSERNEPLI
jgi:hypothetical protein